MRENRFRRIWAEEGGLVNAWLAIANSFSAERLDAVYVGPNDLVTSLGQEPSLEPREREVKEAGDAILATAHKHGLKAGIHCPSGVISSRMIEKGFDFVGMSNDSRLLAAAARAEIAAARGD